MVPVVNACTDEMIPERVRKVPRIVRTNVPTTRLMFHKRSMLRRSCTMAECRKAVAVSHGRNEAFSTGSQAQYPPQPRTSYDHHIPAMMAAERNPQVSTVQLRVRRIQSFDSASPESNAPTPNANGTDIPT